MEIQIGSTITNGVTALRLTDKVNHDQGYSRPGWRGIEIALELRTVGAGQSHFIADEALPAWHHVPFEWKPAAPGWEYRYVWSPDWRYLARETRPVEARCVCGAARGLGSHDCETVARIS